jgi:hypothetical protein
MLAAFGHRNMTGKPIARPAAPPDFGANPHPSRLRRVRQMLRNPKALRTASGLNQTDFWRKYGATQSAGSRYESDRPVGIPTQILMVLEALGYVDQRHLVEAVRLVEEAGQNRRHRE